MNDILGSLLPLFFIAVFPAMLHLSALGGANFYPTKQPRSSMLRFLAYRAIKGILLSNGVLLAAAYFLWRGLDVAWWFVPVLLAVPGLISQLVVLVYAKYSDYLTEAKKIRRNARRKTP